MSVLCASQIPRWVALVSAFVSTCAALTAAGPTRAEYVGSAEPHSSPGPIEFWTIEPNEGQSSGGHSVLRIGDVVYHVEHRGDGLIIDRRDPVDAFERVYRLMGNRSIDVLELDLPENVERALESRLRHRYFDRKRRLDELADLEEDLAWLNQTIERGRLEVYVPGLGLIDDQVSGCIEARARVTRRTRLIGDKNPGWLANRISGARRALHRAIQVATGAPATSLRPDRSEIPITGGTRDVVEAAQRLAAFEVVSLCRPPRRDLVVSLRHDDAWLELEPTTDSFAAGELWQSIESQLEANLRRLLESDRSDSGLAILLAWSRLTALDVTRESSIVHVLDPFSETTDRFPNPARRVPEAWRNARSANAQANLRAALQRMGTQTHAPIESKLFRIETARHSLAHAVAGDLHRRDELESELRVTRATRFRGATVDLPWPNGLTLDAVKRRRNQIAERVKAKRNQLAAELGYALFTRNCVTELFSALDDALSSNPETASFSQARLKDIEAPLAFIPVVAGRIAARQLPISGRRHLPGWRKAVIDAQRTSSIADLALAIRESNTLTSVTYHANPRDSIFVFFSQEPVWARPMAGVTNLLVGVSAAALGAFTAPFDRGELTKRGLQGAVMSVPELFFFNVRKGSFMVSPPAETDH